MTFRSKLPDVETTIFTLISRRAAQTGALNIGQGFPDYPIDARLGALVGEAIAEGRNQYAPMEGVLELRQAIAEKILAHRGVTVDAANEITVTCGATEALFSALQTLVTAGDEVIVFEPAYDAYEPAIRLAGGVCVRIPLLPPSFKIDWQRARDAVNSRTRAIILNNPHNPACSVAAEEDIAQLAALTATHNIFVLSDEVYEHVIFDSRRHVSVLDHPELRTRSFAAFSFGKTLHVTGWRTGYCIAPPDLTREFRKVHQFNTFSISTPMQVAMARFLRERPDCWQGLSEFFQRKRDLLIAGLQGTGFITRPSAGTYFQLVDFSALSDEDDVSFADRLIHEALLAPIPLSPFYREPQKIQCVRLCIAKQDATLHTATTRLREFALRQAA